MIFQKRLMEKTTIYLSSRSLVVAGLLLGSASVQVRAQQADSTIVLPDVHVVQEGETLWDLAGSYYGDPFLWPEIYRLNTMVVEDPHWIFPGEELVFGTPPDAREPVAVSIEMDGGNDSTVVALPDTLPFEVGAPPVVAQSTRFRPNPVSGGGSVAVGNTVEESFRPIRSHQFYSAGFLTEREELPFGDVRGKPGTRSGRIATATSAVIHSDVEIVAPASGSYQIGDTLQLFDRRREISQWGNVMVPTGLALVTNVSGRRTLARIITQFELVLADQVSLPLEPFRDPGNVRPQPVEDGLRATIIGIRDRHPVPSQADVVFLDAGRVDGLVPGDIMEVIAHREESVFVDAPDERVAVLKIVHVRENSASGVLTHIFNSGVEIGAEVKLTLKMPT
jgi:hypothetical protein